MHPLYVCPQGHRWQTVVNSNAPPCPICGAGGRPLGAGVEPTLVVSAATGRADPPTLALDPGAAPRDDSGEQTVGTGAGLEAAPAPRSVPGYEILGELGRGGMGVVYKARHTRLNRVVALKMILAGVHAGPQELIRFRAEGEAVALLQHANIVQIYEVGDHEGHPYFSLEFVEGGSLSDRLDGTPQPALWSSHLIETLARAVHHAHKHGIVHRDLKPANILLSPPSRNDGQAPGSDSWFGGPAAPDLGQWTPKLTDFGLAKRLESNAGQTKTGAVLGTPSYIAPEQAAGRKEVGPAADVYALGAILYELLTGRPPFRGETSMDTMLQVMTEEPVPPRRLQPKVPVDLETICLKCLQKDAPKRFTSAEGLADDLARLRRNEPIQARPIGMLGRGIKWARRRPAAAALVVVSTAALIGLLVGGWLVSAALARAYDLANEHADDAERERGEAATQRDLAQDARQVADRKRRLAEERVEHARRSLYGFQLVQVAALATRDPGRALDLLDDDDRCPADLRDFTWAYLHRLSSRELGPLNGPKGEARCLAVSPDGKQLASSCDDTIVLWSLAKPEPRILKGRHDGPIVALTFAPDGQTIASASFDKTVKLWDVTTAAEAATLQNHTEGVRCVAFSTDGKTLASGSHDGSIRLWDVANKNQRAELPGKAAVCAVAFAPDGKTLASAGADHLLHFWDWQTQKEIGTPLAGHERPVLALAFAPDSRTLASAGEDGHIRLWNPATRKETTSLPGHPGTVHTLAFTPDGHALASGGTDHTVRMWLPATGEERLLLRIPRQTAFGIAFTADGKSLLAACGDSAIKRWDARLTPGEPLRRVALGANGGQGPTTAFAGTDLLTVKYLDNSIRLWDLATGKDRELLPNLQIGIEAIASSQDGSTLAVACDDRTIKLFDRGKDRPRAMLAGLRSRCRCLTFAPGGKLLVSGESDGSLRLWDAVEGRALAILGSHQGPVHCLAFSGDGRFLASSGEDRLVKLWDVASRAESWTLPERKVAADGLALSADGSILALDAEGGTTQLWNTTRREVQTTLQGHADDVRALAFAPDDRTLATGHADWSVLLWDAQTGQQRASLPGLTGPVLALSFVQNGEALAGVGTDGMARLWRAGK